MHPVILFRKQFDDDGEMALAARYFPVVNYRTEVPTGRVVIGRFACLPYYDELAADLANQGSRLINSLAQHAYVANFDYYQDIEDLTFPTWFNFVDIPTALRDSAFVVKGRTNSRKLQWATHMFAKDFRAAVTLGGELSNDPFIGPQGLIVRQYVPLETLEVALNGMPITNEWRLFFYRDALLACGYYWGIIDDESLMEKARPDFLETGVPFARKAAARLMGKVNFFVIDIAKTVEGEWRVVEVNDGQQSGRNHYVDANTLYENLVRAVTVAPPA